MSTINFNDKIFAQEALIAFAATLTPLGAFSRNFNQEAKQQGSEIAVPRVEPLTATTFSYSNNSDFPYEASSGTINTITVSIDQHQICTFDMTDIQAGTFQDWIKIAQQQGAALGKTVLQKIWASFTTTNYGAAVVSLNIADYGVRSLARAKLGLVKRDVPRAPLSVVVDEDVMGNLLGDPGLSNAAAYGGSEVIREGKIPRAFGMTVYDSNIIPANGISLVGFVAHPDALAVAMRYLQPQDPGAYISAEMIADPSGIVMGYRRHYNAGKGKMYGNLECLFGFTVGLTLGLGLLTRND